MTVKAVFKAAKRHTPRDLCRTKGRSKAGIIAKLIVIVEILVTCSLGKNPLLKYHLRGMLAVALAREKTAMASLAYLKRRSLRAMCATGSKPAMSVARNFLSENVMERPEASEHVVICISEAGLADVFVWKLNFTKPYCFRLLARHCCGFFNIYFRLQFSELAKFRLEDPQGSPFRRQTYSTYVLENEGIFSWC